METRELILGLCCEAGHTGPVDDIVNEWEGDHGCCCKLNAEDAARGNIAVLNQTLMYGPTGDELISCSIPTRSKGG